MSFEAVAKRYAQAIFELGVESSSVSTLADDVKKIADAYASSAELRGALSNPLVSAASRTAVLNELSSRLGLTPLAKNAIGLLASRRRLPALPALARELARLSDERAGITRAVVTSAAPLSEDYCRKLTQELEQITGKKVLLVRKHDPSLLAGVVTSIGDRVIDGSARTRLREIRDALLA